MTPTVQPVLAQAWVLAVNAGSSSLKFGLYPAAGPALVSGQFDGLQAGGQPALRLSGRQITVEVPAPGQGSSQATAAGVYGAVLAQLGAVLVPHLANQPLLAVVHRVVHGGADYQGPVQVNAQVLGQLERLVPLAPLHQPHNLAGIRCLGAFWPGVPQIAVFDTAFHAQQPNTERLFALPQDEPALAGVLRYGFHGLSYQFVSQTLARKSAAASGRLVMLHLGNGASVCGALNGVGQCSSMGFSALDGLVMGTRCGELDPGVVLHLMRQGWGVDRLEDLLYRRSGLLGLSGESADMRQLLLSERPRARQAVDLFVARAAKAVASAATVLGGIDAVAFTGGIGENQPEVRQAVLARLAFMGLRFNPDVNRDGGAALRSFHTPDSSAELWVVPTDEGSVAAQAAFDLLATQVT